MKITHRLDVRTGEVTVIEEPFTDEEVAQGITDQAEAAARQQREEAAQKATEIRAEAVGVLLDVLAADNPRVAEVLGRLEAAKSYQRGEPVR